VGVDEVRGDIQTDLETIIRQLGEPLATHEIRGSSVAWRVTLGTIIVLASIVFHIAFWTEWIPWPKGAKAIKIWIFVIVGGIGIPAYGVYLVNFALKSAKQWVLVYGTGLFVWHKGEVIALPWDELAGMIIEGLPEKSTFDQVDDANGIPESAAYDLSKSAGRLTATVLKLVRLDGSVVDVPSLLTGFADLSRTIQVEVFRRIFPVHRVLFQNLEPVEYGPVIVNLLGITTDKGVLLWPDFEGVLRKQGNLEFRKKGKWGAWAKVETNLIPNIHILTALCKSAEALLKSAPIASDDSDSPEDPPPRSRRVSADE
jgi:hypothetical protein